MKILEWLNRNRNTSISEWENTEEGRRFYQKCLSDAEKRRFEKEEWERTVPPEKKEQAKLFKILFTLFFALYTVLLHFGFKTGSELWVLAGEGIFSGISLALFFIKPRHVKYPSCFMMPVVAMGCVSLFYFYMGFHFGFNPELRKKSAPGNSAVRTEREADGGQDDWSMRVFENSPGYSAGFRGEIE